MISHGSSAVLTLHRYNEKNVDDPSIQCKAQIRNMPPKMTFSLLLEKAEKDYYSFSNTTYCHRLPSIFGAMKRAYTEFPIIISMEAWNYFLFLFLIRKIGSKGNLS